MCQVILTFASDGTCFYYKRETNGSFVEWILRTCSKTILSSNHDSAHGCFSYGHMHAKYNLQFIQKMWYSAALLFSTPWWIGDRKAFTHDDVKEVINIHTFARSCLNIKYIDVPKCHEGKAVKVGIANKKDKYIEIDELRKGVSFEAFGNVNVATLSRYLSRLRVILNCLWTLILTWLACFLAMYSFDGLVFGKGIWKTTSNFFPIASVQIVKIKLQT